MKTHFLRLLGASVVCAIPFLAFDMWTWARFKSGLHVDTDLLDTVVTCLAYPGRLCAGLFVIVAYGNVHLYNLYVALAVEIAANGVLYDA